MTLEGTGSAFEAVIGQAVVYDHLYTDVGHVQITGSNGMGMGTYTTQVSYRTSFTGIQEGLVAVYHNNGGLSNENVTVVMMKVLLSPAPQQLTVSSVDLTVSPNSITGISYGSRMTLTYTATFHVQADHTPCAAQGLEDRRDGYYSCERFARWLTGLVGCHWHVAAVEERSILTDDCRFVSTPSRPT